MKQARRQTEDSVLSTNPTDALSTVPQAWNLTLTLCIRVDSVPLHWVHYTEDFDPRVALRDETEGKAI